MISDFAAWSRELAILSDIPQDGDNRYSPEESERRFNRLIELIDEVETGAGKDIAKALLHVIKDQDDYGAYETILDVLFGKVNRALFMEVLIEELPGLIQRNEEVATEILGDLSYVNSDAYLENRRLWLKALGKAPASSAEAIGSLIRKQFPNRRRRPFESEARSKPRKLNEKQKEKYLTGLSFLFILNIFIPFLIWFLGVDLAAVSFVLFFLNNIILFVIVINLLVKNKSLLTKKDKIKCHIICWVSAAEVLAGICLAAFLISFISSMNHF